MQRGFYTSGTGMMLQRRKMENITNNLTNVETVGYKKDHLVSHSFDDVLIERKNDPNVWAYTPTVIRYDRKPDVGDHSFGTLVDTIHTNFDIGNLEETGLPTDMALIGDVFFVVETEEGDRYTKAGNFIVNSQGYLTDVDGNFLRGTDGRIYVGGDKFSVTDNGEVFVGGQYSNTIMIAAFDENQVLRKQGDNLFYPIEGGPGAADAYAVKQGFLENSNVETAREMVDMITTYRIYETNQRILSMIDETMGMSADIGVTR